jgi:hypothetical protein
MPLYKKELYSVGKSSIHMSFDDFKQLPTDCIVIFIERLSRLAEVGRLGVGSARNTKTSKV